MEHLSEETEEEEENMSAGKSRETSGDGYIGRSFEVIFSLTKISLR